MCTVYEEACFSQKNPNKWIKHEFTTTNLSRKDSHWCRNSLSCKEKVMDAVISKEGHADIFLVHERTSIDFLKKLQL